ncbi:MAG: hypothetical protein P8R54_12965 [Myxococcota bacterium]|nr:hypothetical protein [Myxococcota bacterium]
MNRARARPARRGGTFIEDLLTVTVVAVAVIVASYVYMPDFQRGAHTIAAEMESWVYGD